MMDKIFITGGAGYVGSVLTPYLLNKGYHVTVLDLFMYGNTLFPHPNLKIIKGDIRDKALLEKNLKDIDTVIHLACISNDPSFELNPNLGKSINYDAFEPLVKISKLNGVKRFIYASSSSVYGVKEEENVSEEMSLEPLTDYSKFKADCEKVLFTYKSKEFETIVVRPATVCGYSKRQRLDVIVNILTNLAYHKREITVFGGNQLRPNIHIKDMLRAYDALINANASIVNGEIFNAGWENRTVNEIAEMVRNVIGSDVKIVRSNSDDNRSYHISSEKIKKLLSFKTEFSIEDAVRDLKYVFDKKFLINTFDDDSFFNIKKMNKIKLK